MSTNTPTNPGKRRDYTKFKVVTTKTGSGKPTRFGITKEFGALKTRIESAKGKKHSVVKIGNSVSQESAEAWLADQSGALLSRN